MQSKGNVLFSGFKRLWLRYSISKGVVYCSSCVVFGSKASGDKTFVSTQVNNWSNIHYHIKQHEVPSSHIASQRQPLIVAMLSPKRQTET